MNHSTTSLTCHGSLLLLAMSLLFVMGCSDERKISNKAQWLCEYDQLERLPSSAVPAEARLDDYLDSEELDSLRWLRRHTDIFDNPKDLLATVDDDSRQRLLEARAAQTHCTVHQTHLFEESDIAFVDIQRNAPELGIAKDDVKEATQDELEDHLRRQAPRTRSNHLLIFNRTQKGWRAEVGLQPRAMQAELTELEERRREIEQELPRAQQAAEEEQQLHSLTMFRVESASLDITDRRQRWGDLEIDVLVRGTNHGDEPIGGIDFEVVLSVPGEETKKGEFSYSDRLIRAGETREFSLLATDPDAPFGEDVILDERASLDVSVLRLYDQRNRVIAETGGPDPRRARESLEQASQSAQRLKSELDEIKSRHGELSDELAAWKKSRLSQTEGYDLDLPDLYWTIDGLD